MKLKLSSIKNRLKSKICEVVKKIDPILPMDYPNIYLYGNMRLNSVEQEPETVKWIETFNDDDVFFDIGANVGAYSLIASKRNKVYAFEASPFTFNLLCKNIKLNNADITPFNVALYSEDKIGDFLFVQTRGGGSRNSFNANMFKSTYKQSMISMKLDTFVALYNVKRVDRIKLDVDGNELDILNGALETLRKVKDVYVEMDINREQKFKDFFRKHNFNFVTKHNLGDDFYYMGLFRNDRR